MSSPLRYAAALLLAAPLASCSSAYYRALETVGIEKRDILIDRIEEARDSQSGAKEQFSSALDEYRRVVNVEGGDLEEIYDRLSTEYDGSERRAQAVEDRVSAVESVAEDLFAQWEAEIDDYSDQNLRRQSQRLLAGTRADYERLLGAMQRAERSMDPVLTLFRDQVLFLRHNLNARAIGSLQTELRDIEQATATLVAEMERAIAEASRFIETLA
jgi:DUF2959 family protein